MIDFTHTKRPDLIQLVLIIAVACLALGAITPAVSAVDYDWEFSVQSPEISGTINIGNGQNTEIPNALSDGKSIYCDLEFPGTGHIYYGYYGSLTEIFDNPGIYTDLPYGGTNSSYGAFYHYMVLVPSGLSLSEVDEYVRQLANFLDKNTDIPTKTYYVYYAGTGYISILSPQGSSNYYESFNYSYYSSSFYPFYVDVVDSGNDYKISVSGFDGTQLAGSAYTIAVSTYSGGYNLSLTSFPMYLGDSPVHLWTSDQTFRLPVYLSDGVTPIDYYCMLSFPADPTATGYPFWWNMITHGSSEYPFNTTYPPVVWPTPTPLIPSDIIPHPDDLNNTVNFTGWYQEQGFEGNNITAPIYSGLRGWFSENMIPVFDFFLMPIGSLSSMISESAGTSTDAISDSVEQLSIYAAPMNIVGGYVVLLVPDVVWVVVFAALSIGYVVLLIRISTGSIRDTIGRFLGRW